MLEKNRAGYKHTNVREGIATRNIRQKWFSEQIGLQWKSKQMMDSENDDDELAWEEW